MRLSFITRGRLFTADGGAGSGAGGSEGNGNATGQQGQQGQQPPAQAQNGGDEKKFSQSELEAILADRLAREQRKTTEAAEKARKVAEEQALKEQGQFKTLAEQHAARVAELEPRAGQVERFEKALKAQVDELRKGLPAHLTTLLDKMDAVEQLEYLAANRAKLVPQQTQAPNINGGAGTGGQVDEKTREAELRQRFRLSK